MRKIDEIIIHASATKKGWWEGKGVEAIRDEFRRWHKAKNWSDIGYHFVIGTDGAVAKGREVSVMGAHVKGKNRSSIGICLVGGFGGKKDGVFSDNFTPEQDAALLGLIDNLRAGYPTIDRVSGHNEYANKACPCFNVSKWLATPPVEVKSKVRTKKVQSKTVQASIVQGASAVGGAVAAFQSLDGTAQIIAMVGCVLVALTAMFILKERLKAWASGWH
jgi:N-acetylmuramoyl-L-alanine amidase